MPRQRNTENRGHPTGWRWKKNRWRYRVPPGQEALWDNKREYVLGRTLTEAYRTWTSRVQPHGDEKTVSDLLDRYSHQVIPTKAVRTQKGNNESIVRLRSVFGHMPIAALKPTHVYQYLDRQRSHPTSANRNVEVLSHAYTKAKDVVFGLPCEGRLESSTWFVASRPNRRKCLSSHEDYL